MLCRLRLAHHHGGASGRSDGGFTLVEAVVSLLVATMIFTAIAGGLMVSVRAGVTARQNQQAADVLNQEIERVRALDFGALTMVATDLVGDPNVTVSGGQYYFNPGGGAEPVAVASVGGINPHTRQTTLNHVTYTVRTYVTMPSDAQATYRRASVIVTWSTYGRSHTRSESTMIAYTRRGLPLPRFTFTANATVLTNPGAKVALPFTLVNQGARDAWNLSASGLSGWIWYTDPSCSHTWSASNTQFADSDGDGKQDTGLLDTNATSCGFAVHTMGASEFGTFTVTLTAVSSAQPSAPSGTGSIFDTVKSQPAYCSGCTLTTYYLHNALLPGPTTTQTIMPINKTAPIQTSLPAYSTDVTAQPGRYIYQGGSGVGESRSGYVAAWHYQVPSDTVLNGVASVTLFAMIDNGASLPGDVTVYIGSDQNNNLSGFNEAAEKTYHLDAWPAGGMTAFTVSVPINNFTISRGKYMVVRAEVTGGSSYAMRLAYDTTTYNANSVLPVVSGG
jgi:type II secretory pathway pseudopilin PulG